MNFYELGKYKDKITSMFVANADIVDLVMPKSDDIRFSIEDNFLGGNFQAVSGGIEEKVQLIGHCFDVPFVYSMVKDARNIICLDTVVSMAEGEAIKEITVTISVMCHKTNIKLDSATKVKYFKKNLSGNRLDMIVQEVGLILNGSKNFGLGRFKLSPRKPMQSYYANEDFFGKIITYTCEDFMTNYAERSLNGE